ncbi:MAG: hypothetical protein ACXVXN_09245, partial [Mycobacteriaceae bacterium]
MKRTRGARPLWAPLLDNPAASVTAETTVDDASAQMFYDVYLAAFGPMRARAAARNVLHRDEFFAEMVDPRVSKY